MLSTPLSSVLCVDDDPDACEMLSELLKLSKVESQSAGSADEAWSMIRSYRFDLYVLDAWLPGLDGFEFCRQLRKVDATTPILFYSGAAYDSDKQKGIAAGANAYLVKPDVESLLTTLGKLIAQAKIAAITTRLTAIDHPMEANRRARYFDSGAIRTGTYS